MSNSLQVLNSTLNWQDASDTIGPFLLFAEVCAHIDANQIGQCQTGSNIGFRLQFDIVDRNSTIDKAAFPYWLCVTSPGGQPTYLKARTVDHAKDMAEQVIDALVSGFGRADGLVLRRNGHATR